MALENQDISWRRHTSPTIPGTPRQAADDAPAAQVVATAVRASDTNSATWNPTITVSVPASAVGGTYAATLRKK